MPIEIPETTGAVEQRAEERRQASLARADRIWKRTEFEITLATNRVNWLIASQTFLFASSLIILSNEELPEEFVFIPITAGIAIAVTVLIAVHTGFRNVAACRLDLETLRQEYPFDLKFTVDDRFDTRFLGKATMASMYAMIGVFMVLWGGALVMSLLLI